MKYIAILLSFCLFSCAAYAQTAEEIRAREVYEVKKEAIKDVIKENSIPEEYKSKMLVFQFRGEEASVPFEKWLIQAVYKEEFKEIEFLPALFGEEVTVSFKRRGQDPFYVTFGIDNEDMYPLSIEVNGVPQDINDQLAMMLFIIGR